MLNPIKPPSRSEESVAMTSWPSSRHVLTPLPGLGEPDVGTDATPGGGRPGTRKTFRRRLQRRRQQKGGQLALKTMHSLCEGRRVNAKCANRFGLDEELQQWIADVSGYLRRSHLAATGSGGGGDSGGSGGNVVCDHSCKQRTASDTNGERNVRGSHEPVTSLTLRCDVLEAGIRTEEAKQVTIGVQTEDVMAPPLSPLDFVHDVAMDTAGQEITSSETYALEEWSRIFCICQDNAWGARTLNGEIKVWTMPAAEAARRLLRWCKWRVIL